MNWDARQPLPSFLTAATVAPYLHPVTDPGLWTAVIPAAGRGTRLGFDQPKVLYRIAGRTILDHLVDLLGPFCSRFIVVASPAGADAIESHLAVGCPGPCSVAIQERPIGMADAVERGAGLVETVHTLVIWGDQVAIRPSTLETCVRLHEGDLLPGVTAPTLLRRDPYIHLQRNESQRIARVLQKREGDAMPETGENDSGLFLFRTSILKAWLPRLLQSSACRGNVTGELNFLPILPLLDSTERNVLTARIVEQQETIGVNTPEEAALLEQHLPQRQPHATKWTRTAV